MTSEYLFWCSIQL